MIPLAVRAVGMISSVGDGALECSASVRAGITRVAESSIRSREMRPLRMGLVPARSLPEVPWIDAAPRCSRQRRILRLAQLVMKELDAALGEGVRPVVLVTSALDDGAPLLDDLALLPDVHFDRAASVHLPMGAGSAFVGVLNAAQRIASGQSASVTLLCADSHLDLARLDALQRARRLLVDDVTDGFIPGEGAAALVLTADGPGALARISAVGAEHDPFTPEGEHPLDGEGLSRAVRVALNGSATPAGTLWTGLNGESWQGREWAIAARRSHREIDRAAAVHHPVEFFGDPGAALGGVLLALATVGMARGFTPGPALAWAISEGGVRGAARVEAAG